MKDKKREAKKIEKAKTVITKSGNNSVPGFIPAGIPQSNPVLITNITLPKSKWMDENTVATLTKSVINNPSQSIVIANKRVLLVDVNLLYIDTAYQTMTRHRRSKGIESLWDAAKSGEIVVSYRDGKFFVIDGAHRVAAALLNDEPYLLAIIHTDLDIIQEAELFADQNQRTIPVSPYDLYNANLIAGKPDDIAILNIANKYGCSITQSKTKDERRAITAIGSSKEIMSDKSINGAKCFDWMLATMDSCYWCDQPGFGESNWFKAFHQTYKDAILNKCLDRYTKNIITVLSHVTPSQLKGFASIETPSAEHRAKCIIVLKKIAKGEVTLDKIYDTLKMEEC